MLRWNGNAKGANTIVHIFIREMLSPIYNSLGDDRRLVDCHNIEKALILSHHTLLLTRTSKKDRQIIGK
jgi:hypothetical protein